MDAPRRTAAPEARNAPVIFFSPLAPGPYPRLQHFESVSRHPRKEGATKRSGANILVSRYNLLVFKFGFSMVDRKSTSRLQWNAREAGTLCNFMRIMQLHVGPDAYELGKSAKKV
jgi:hypothetical protein